MIRGLILNYNLTLYNPDKQMLMFGAKELLDFCSGMGIKLSLISRGELHRKQEIKDLGIDCYFTMIVLISKEKKEEKGQSPFQECADAMGLQPKEVAVVGDRVRDEVK